MKEILSKNIVKSKSLFKFILKISYSLLDSSVVEWCERWNANRIKWRVPTSNPSKVSTINVFNDFIKLGKPNRCWFTLLENT